MDPAFLASYPRSGNTWARVLLYHALYGGDGPAPTTADIAGRVPDLHVDGEVERASAGGAPEIVKTHFPHSAAHPYLGGSSRAIVLVRHPRDVLLSCLAFHRVLETRVKDRRSGRDAPLRPIDYARSFIAAGGDPVWSSQGFATWEACTRSWLDAPLPALLVRYEDLLDDTAAQLGRMLDFLGRPADDAAVSRAVGASSFDRMRALEVSDKASRTGKSTFFGGNARTMRRGVYFMDRARRGGSLEAIQPGLDRAFDERFADAMRQLGYA